MYTCHSCAHFFDSNIIPGLHNCRSVLDIFVVLQSKILVDNLWSGGVFPGTDWHSVLCHPASKSSKNQLLGLIQNISSIIMASTSELPVIPRVKLGPEGFEVSALGLGCMGMSAFYGSPKPEADMIELIRYAVNSGVTFLDTSDRYGPHTNEVLVGKVMVSLDLCVYVCVCVSLSLSVFLYWF